MTRANAASSNLQESSGRCDYQPGGLARCGLGALDDVPVLESVHPQIRTALGRSCSCTTFPFSSLTSRWLSPNVVPVDSILAGLFPKSLPSTTTVKPGGSVKTVEVVAQAAR